MIDDSLLFERATIYGELNQIEVLRNERLGHGSDGAVWQTSRPSAVKALQNEKNYRIELECYQRLKQAGVQELCGFAVPVLEGWSDELRVIEMTIVQPPYLLDFGKVHVGSPPPYFFDKQFKSNTYAEWRSLFGKRWSDVAFLMSSLEKYGIWYVDPRPANIAFAPGDEDSDDDLDDDIDYSSELEDEP